MRRLSRLRKRVVHRLIVRRARRLSDQLQRTAMHPVEAQAATLRFLMDRARDTRFGRDHDFASVRTYEDLKHRVPLRDYEALRPYLQRVIAGEPDVLWPGRPVGYACTSGTTSGTKYIPITRDFLGPYIKSGRQAVSRYIAETANAACVTGRLFYFANELEVDRFQGIPAVPISGISYAQLPGFVRRRFLPSGATNRLSDFEEKIELAVRESLGQDVTLVSGIPPWIQVYFNRLIDRTGKPIKEIFPHLSVLIHGGVGIGPYRASLEAAMGTAIDTVEVYPASEGFIAFQDTRQEGALLLNLRGGLFFEFVPLEDLLDPAPMRVSLRDVELGVQYAVVLHTAAGLWGYLLGDTVKFVSKTPYRLVVTGRTGHFLSTAGEHLVAEDVETALAEALRDASLRVNEFTVAPQLQAASGVPYHEWLLEFDEVPSDLEAFAAWLHARVGEKNLNYQKLCQAGILLPLAITVVRPGGFAAYMKSVGRLGDQNKVPHLSNDRRLADALLPYTSSRS